MGLRFLDADRLSKSTSDTAAHARTAGYKSAAAHRDIFQSGYYRNCKETWGAGAALLYRGRPGYRRELDGDVDDIACEPNRPR